MTDFIHEKLQSIVASSFLSAWLVADIILIVIPIDTPKEKILFIDFNGVISYDPFWSSLFNPDHPKHNWSRDIHNHLFTGKNNLVMDWMRGNLRAEDIHDELEKEFGFSKTELLAIFEEDCRSLDLSVAIRDLLEEYKKDHHIIMITDNMDSMERYTIPANFDYFSVFDRIDNSYRMRRLKKDNNGQYFEDVMNQLGVRPENCLYIDDSEKNCQVFTERFPEGAWFNTKTETEVVLSLGDFRQK